MDWIRRLISVDLDGVPAPTYLDDLESQNLKLLPMAAFTALLSWIPFLEVDLELFPGVRGMHVLRGGLTVIGLLLLLRVLVPRKVSAYALSLGLFAYLLLAGGAIVGLSGGHPSYIGGLCILMLLLVVWPLRLDHTLALAFGSLLLFVAFGLLQGLSIRDAADRYSLYNLLVTTAVAVMGASFFDRLRQAHHANRLRIQEVIQDLEGAVERERGLRRNLEAALATVRQLSGLLPICARCKKIRDDQGYWLQIEGYIEAHSQAEFSHSLCPECMEILYPDFKPGEDPGTG